MRATLLIGLCALGLAVNAEAQGKREATVTEIPGVIAGGAQWKLVWQGTDNADGIIASPGPGGAITDGGLLFAQEQPSRIRKLDEDDKVSVFLEDTHGTGALAIDNKGRVLAIERTCTDPGGSPSQCKEPTVVGVLSPEHKIIADNINGQGLGRLNDLMVAKNGGVYFNGGALFYVSPSGQVSAIGDNLRTNGIMLSRNEKTLYVTNGMTLVAFDVKGDGLVKNQHEFAKLEAGGSGDGMAIDSEGRLYVTSQPGVQVFNPQGKYLGLIATPRPVISAAFTGPNKKILYVVGAGALGPDGQEFQTPAGVRNNAKTIYKITMLAQGFSGRVK